MLCKKTNKKPPMPTVSRHLWANDPEIAQMRRSLYGWTFVFNLT
jgi:hypothetical protein